MGGVMPPHGAPPPAALRVAIVAPTAEMAGAERALLALVTALPEFGIAPTVLGLVDGEAVGQLRDAGAEVLLTRTQDVPLRSPMRLRRQTSELRGMIRCVDPAVVHGFGEKMAVLAGAASIGLQLPLVVHLHDSPARDWQSRTLHNVLKWVPRAATVAPSASLASELRGTAPDCLVIPNGVGQEAATAAPVALFPGKEVEAPVVGMVGRLDTWKGVEVFLRAAALVRATHPQVRWAVVGGGLYSRAQGRQALLESLAAGLGLDASIVFTGHRSDALGLMKGIDILVHASTRPEPFGMVLIEGMAQGKTLLASALGAPLEIVTPEYDGLLIAPGDEALLAAAIVRALDDRGLRARLSQGAERTFRERYSARAVAERFSELYRSVATQGVAPGRSGFGVSRLSVWR